MEAKKLSELRASEKQKILAAVLKIFEHYNFLVGRDFGVRESLENPAKWILAFSNEEEGFGDLEGVKGHLGEKFQVSTWTKSKDSFIVRIEAEGMDFLRLVSKVI